MNESFKGMNNSTQTGYDAVMIEAEWLACSDPDAMVAALPGPPSPRKRVMFAAACWRRRGSLDADTRAVVEAMERVADGLASRTAWVEAARVHHARVAAESVFVPGPFSDDYVDSFAQRPDPDLTLPVEHWFPARGAERRAQADLLRDVIGNPHRPAPALDPIVLAPAIAVARSIYDARTFDRLPELADTLERAGCTDVDVLAHCRGPGPHVRGCWVVDLILGKS